MTGQSYTNIGAIDGEFSEAIVACTAGAGTNAMVAGVAGQSVRLYKGFIAAAAASTVVIAGGAVGLTGTMSMAAGQMFSWNFDGTPWFESGNGNALNIIQLSSNVISGRIYYRQG